MTFHRKQYRAIAEILARSQTIAELEENLIEYFEQDNSLFDPQRFKDFIREMKEQIRDSITDSL